MPAICNELLYLLRLSWPFASLGELEEAVELILPLDYTEFERLRSSWCANKFYEGEGISDFLVTLSLSFLFKSEVGFLRLLLNCKFLAKLLAKFI